MSQAVRSVCALDGDGRVSVVVWKERTLERRHKSSIRRRRIVWERGVDRI